MKDPALMTPAQINRELDALDARRYGPGAPSRLPRGFGR
jgi:hypothetical protein